MSCVYTLLIHTARTFQSLRASFMRDISRETFTWPGIVKRYFYRTPPRIFLYREYQGQLAHIKYNFSLLSSLNLFKDTHRATMVTMHQNAPLPPRHFSTAARVYPAPPKFHTSRPPTTPNIPKAGGRAGKLYLLPSLIPRIRNQS
jgi:hypothetical protein